MVGWFGWNYFYISILTTFYKFGKLFYTHPGVKSAGAEKVSKKLKIDEKFACNPGLILLLYISCLHKLFAQQTAKHKQGGASVYGKMSVL